MLENPVDDPSQKTENVKFDEEDFSAGDKNQSVLSIKHAVRNVKKLLDKEWHYTQPFYVQGLKWSIGMQLTPEQVNGQLMLGLYLCYLDGADASRPVVDIEVELRIFNHLDSNLIYKKELCELFNTSGNGKIGISHFIFWADLLNSQRGYVKDDTIIIQVYLASTPPMKKIDLSSAETGMAGASKKNIVPLSAKSKSDDERLQNRLLSVSDRALNLLDSGIGSDCEFLVSDGEETRSFRACKLFLAKHSETFERMFFGEFEKQNSIKVEDVKPAVFYQMLKHVYGCDWSFESEENAKDLYYLADRYFLDDLKKSCLEYLWPKDVDSLWCAFDLAIQFNLSELRTACLKIICEYTAEVFKSDNFLQLCQASLITILEQKQLNSSEMQVFNAAVKWATAQCRSKGFPINGTNLRLELGEGIKFIRFLTMTLTEMIGEPYELGILTPEEGMAYVRASVDSKQYLPPTGLCPLRKSRRLTFSDSLNGRQQSSTKLGVSTGDVHQLLIHSNIHQPLGQSQIFSFNSSHAANRTNPPSFMFR